MPETSYQNYFKIAQHHYQTADHLLGVTYLLVKDSKLLIAIIESLNQCAENAIKALTAFHYRNHKIPPQKNYWGIFQSEIAPFYHLSQEDISLIITLREIANCHRQSAVEFSRAGKRILCSKEYKLRILTPKDVKEHLVQCRQFLNRINKIIS